MKKLILFSVLIFLNCKVWCNIAPPQAFICEVYIESPEIWSIELGFYDYPNQFDSIVVETNSGLSKVSLLNVDIVSFDDVNEGGRFPFHLIVITEKDLEEVLEINRENDFIRIYSYIGANSNNDYLAFGNNKDSNIPVFKENHSISEIGGNYYSLDNSPSIGERNSIDGTEGYVSGYVYDTNGNPLPNHEIEVFIRKNITTDENGYYGGYVFSNAYYFDTLKVQAGQFEFYIYEKDTINVFPDSIHYNDLIFKDLVIIPYDDPTSTRKIFSNNTLVANYPNPFTSYTVFQIAIPEDINFKTSRLNIYNSLGASVFSIQLEDRITSITLTAQEMNALKTGTYYYTIYLDDNTLLSRNTMIKL